MKNEYRVNGNDAVIAGRAANLKNRMRNVSQNDLNRVVIPAIDAAINNANRQIARIQEEERRRQEEESNQ